MKIVRLVSIFLMFNVIVISCHSYDNEILHSSVKREASFEVGQIWTYHTRDSEERSRVVIGKVEMIGDDIVIHISITNITLRNPFSDSGYQRSISQAAIFEDALKQSVIKLSGHMSRPVTGFQEGYDTWKNSDESGYGYFASTVREIIDIYQNGIDEMHQKVIKKDPA